MDELVFSVSDFVAVFNQTLEYAYPSVAIVGELSNFRVSKNRWVYFDLKDEQSTVKFFGTVYNLPGPLEDGLMLQVRGAPRLHNQFGFSVNIQSIRPVGEGSIKKAAQLLEAKLAAEGLFAPERKRTLPYPPHTIGLVASGQSAAYHDFVKILNARWGGLNMELADVQVQGEVAPGQIVRAIEYFNSKAKPVDVLVVVRGGGSADDLAAFNTEPVVRAVAASRIPTLVAIGHEVDVSLAELAADQRASTPSNAAELLVPDKKHQKESLLSSVQSLDSLWRGIFNSCISSLEDDIEHLSRGWLGQFERHVNRLDLARNLLNALDPKLPLKRGFSIVSKNGQVVTDSKQLKLGDDLEVAFDKGQVRAKVDRVK